MKKEEVKQRVLQNGKPLNLSKFIWDENNNRFSTEENNLIIDFANINNCKFKTGTDCFFKTGYNCFFDTLSDCTFKTFSDCTFKTGSDCAIVRRDAFEVIGLIEIENNIKILPYPIKGYITKNKDDNFFHFPNEKDRIEIFDGIVSKIVSQKENVFKVINYGETKESYIIKEGEYYAHGKTLKEAKEDLIYKKQHKPYNHNKFKTFFNN